MSAPRDRYRPRTPPRHCSLCGATMPMAGNPRLRNGRLTCSTCDPSDRPEPKTRASRSLHPTGSLTTNRKHLTRALLESQAALLSDDDYAQPDERPRTWGACAGETGPCAFVSCRHHLYLDVNPETGSIKLNFPDLEPEDLEHPCALRLATAGAHHLEEVGVRLNLTRERVRQLEEKALVQIRRLGRRLDDLRPRPL